MTSILCRSLHRLSLSAAWLPYCSLASIPSIPSSATRSCTIWQNLPLELERHIFELALFSQAPSAALNLLLVAHRTHIWLQPLFYDTVILSTSGKAKRFVATLQTRPESYFKTHVKSLLIRADDAYLHPVILTTCNNVCQLTILPATSASSVLHPLLHNITFPNLTHLAINLDSSFGVAKIDFSSPIFQRVTHLQVHNSLVRTKTAWNGMACVIIDDMDNQPNGVDGHMQSTAMNATVNARSDPSTHADGGAQGPAVVAFLPNLTHLSMQGLGFSSAPYILELCPRLKCLVFERHPEHAVGLEIQDPRFVRGNPRDSTYGTKADVAKPGAKGHVGVIEGMGAGEVVFGWWEEMEYWAMVDEAVAKNTEEYERRMAEDAVAIDE